MSSKPIVVVTGASGYLAGHVIKKLIEKGYHTRGTVRNKVKAEQLQKAFPELELFEADLTKDGSFDEVVKGATFVFHTASPFPSGQVADAEKELIEPALKGTLTVLESAHKAGTVLRVVVTSSVAAIAGKKPEDHVFTESDWNLDSTASFESYRYSKRVAEEAAWNFVKEHNSFSLVTILPSFILGPPLSINTADATSVNVVKGFFEGKYNKNCFPVVDVRDVAEAHIRAAERPDATGRYMVTSERGVPNFELSQVLVKSGQFDQYIDQLPKTNELGSNPSLRYSSSKAKKELELEFTPLEKSLVDMAHALIDFGLVPKKP